jgi:chemotaxis protein methyltransferase WspC
LNPVDEARRQANAGRLDDALRTCQTHLASAGPSAGLYSLMGVVHQARRESDEAERCFRKALYLQPELPEALLHLMILTQRRGDCAESDRLRCRLERLSPGGNA